MTTYFDMVNDDIISQILIHVNDVMSYGKLVTLNFFGHVLGNYKFWNMLVKVKFSNITFDLIPNYLYTFDKKDDFIIWYSNYFRLNSAYSYATRYTNNFEKELRETGEYYGKKSEGYKFHAPTMRFALNLVNNIKVLNGAWLGFDARPVAVNTVLAYSLKRLGVEYIDIYRPSRLDPTVPIEETIGAIAEMVKAGYVRHIGLSGLARRPSGEQRWASHRGPAD